MFVFARFEGPASALLELAVALFFGVNDKLCAGAAVTLVFCWVEPRLNMGATACLVLGTFAAPKRVELKDKLATLAESPSAQLLSRCLLMSLSATAREHIGLGM